MPVVGLSSACSSRGVGRVARRPADRPPQSSTRPARGRRRRRSSVSACSSSPSPCSPRLLNVVVVRFGDADGLAHHERAAPRHHPSRARPRPRVPPHAHAGRADPARRRRRHRRSPTSSSQVVPKAAGAAILLMPACSSCSPSLDWRLGAGMLVYLGSASPARQSMRHRAVRESSDEMGAYARLYGGIEERLTAVEDLRCQRRRRPRDVAVRRGQLRRCCAAPCAASRRSSACGGRVQSAVDRRARCSASCCRRSLVANGAITLGTGFLLFQYVQLMIRPLEDLVHQLETVQKANGAMVRVIDLLGVEADDRRRRHDVAAAGRARRVVPSPSRLAYGARLPTARRATILHDVDLDVAGGRSVGVVGRTGSGKTTFSRLLLRLVETTDGHRAARRRADRRHPAGRAAPPRRPRAPGGRAVRGHDPRQRHAVRPGADRCRRERRAAPRRPRRARRRPGSTARSAPAAPGCRPARRSCWRSPACGCASPTSSCSTRRRRRVDPVTEQRLEAAVAELIEGPHDVRHRPPAVDAATWSTRSSCSTTVGSSSTATARSLADTRTAASATCSSSPSPSNRTRRPRCRGGGRAGGDHRGSLACTDVEQDLCMSSRSRARWSASERAASSGLRGRGNASERVVMNLWRLAWQVCQARAAFVLARLDRVRRLLLAAGAHRLPAGARLRRAVDDGDTPTVYRFAAAVAVAETVRMAVDPLRRRSRGPRRGCTCRRCCGPTC